MHVGKDFKPSEPLRLHPMGIEDFGKLDARSQADSVGDMVAGAAQVLNESKRPDLAAKVRESFTAINCDAAEPAGRVEPNQ